MNLIQFGTICFTVSPWFLDHQASKDTRKPRKNSLPWIEHTLASMWEVMLEWSLLEPLFFDQQFLVIGTGRDWILYEWILKCMYDNYNRWSRFMVFQSIPCVQRHDIPKRNGRRDIGTMPKHSNEKTSEHSADYRRSSKRIEGGCTMKGSTIIPCQREGLFLASIFSLWES